MTTEKRPLQFQWHSEDKMIFLIYYHEGWQWTDLRDAVDELVLGLENKDDADQVVVVHVFQPHVGNPPGAFKNIYQIFRDYDAQLPSTMRYILVNANRFLIALVKLVAATLLKFLNISEPVFVDSLDEAMDLAISMTSSGEPQS